MEMLKRIQDETKCEFKNSIAQLENTSHSDAIKRPWDLQEVELVEYHWSMAIKRNHIALVICQVSSLKYQL